MENMFLSFLCLTSCLIQNSPESKDFYLVLFLRIKQEAPVYIPVFWNQDEPLFIIYALWNAFLVSSCLDPCIGPWKTL